ncbi:hypothetical protein EYC98_08400, partial [Halieaceae bacterium IMCC14734]
TTADVNAIAQQLTYSNTNDLPPASVQINWDLSDGNGTAQGTGGALSASGSMTVSITSVNENPTLTGVNATPTYVEDQPAIVLDSTVTIADVELDALNGGAGDYTGASLTLARNIAVNPDDVFGFTAGSGISLSGGNLLKGGDIIASFDTSVAGELTITFTSPATAVATTADVNAIAQQLTYSNTNDLPPASVQINWDLNDGNGTAQGTGGALGASGSMTVNITSINENPTLTGVDATPTYVEDQPAIVLDNNVTIADVELDALNGGAGDYSGASLTLARNLAANSDDVFGFVDGNDITLSSGNLVKNGDVIANFDTSVAGELTITYVSVDGEIPTTADVNAIQRQITYSNSNDLPPTSVDIDWDFNDGNLGLQGLGNMLASGGTLTVTIESVNEAPTVSGLTTINYVENSNAIVLDSDVVIADKELDIIGDYSGSSLTLVRSGAAHSDDIFGFADSSEIALIGGSLIKSGQAIADFDISSPGQLTITFTNVNGETPTTADVNAIAQQLTYANASNLPPAAVQIDWSFDDGNGGLQGTGLVMADTQSQIVTIGSVNEAPTFIGLDAITAFIENQPAVVLDADMQVQDLELDSLGGGAGNYDGASLVLQRLGGVNSDDVFGFADSSDITRVGDSLLKAGAVIADFDTSINGQVTLRFSDANGEVPTSVDVNDIVQKLTYSNSNDMPATQVQVEWQFDDGNSGAQGTGGIGMVIGTSTVQITAVDDTAPELEANTGSNLATGSIDGLSITELRYTDSEQRTDSISYNVTSAASSGFLARSDAPDTAITQFTQAEIDSGEVVYIHTEVGTEFDSFDFTVTDGQGNTSAVDTFGIQIEVQDTQIEVFTGPRGLGDPLPVVDLDMLDKGFTSIEVQNPPLEEYNRKGGIFEDTPVADPVAPALDNDADFIRSEPTQIQRVSVAVEADVTVSGPEREVRAASTLQTRGDSALIRMLDTSRNTFADTADYTLAAQQQAQSEPQTAAETLLFALDDMREQLESSLAEQYSNELLMGGSARMAGVTLSAGYLAWLLRAGPLLASVAASVPTWARFDPLPVVLTNHDKQEEDFEELTEQNKLDAEQEEAATYLLDNSAYKGQSSLMEGRDS